jgi:general secretion pathway protein D
LHSNNEVSLQLQFEIRNLAGSALNGIPIISNRTIEQSVRLRENETTIISGMLETDEMRSISGLPGLAPIPIGGLIAGKLQSRPRETELIIMITPRQLRLIPIAGRALYAGRGDEPIPHGEGPQGQPQTAPPQTPPPQPGMPPSQPLPPRPNPPQPPLPPPP